MPDKTTVAGELPKLPVPDHQFTKATGAFSADQMRAYATAALAQKDGKIERLRWNLQRIANLGENTAPAARWYLAEKIARAALGSQA